MEGYLRHYSLRLLVVLIFDLCYRRAGVGVSESFHHAWPSFCRGHRNLDRSRGVVLYHDVYLSPENYLSTSCARVSDLCALFVGHRVCHMSDLGGDHRSGAALRLDFLPGFANVFGSHLLCCGCQSFGDGRDLVHSVRHLCGPVSGPLCRGLDMCSAVLLHNSAAASYKSFAILSRLS